jgi:glyoxylase-like metal-dependent hydrolase (beta-lactamase superfamily II)
MPSTWIVTHTAVAPIHTFIAPEEGWLVTSHIIELPSQLFVVDAQYALPYARAVARYAEELKKPLTRLYVTHYHPDHLLGAAVFKAPMVALDVWRRRSARPETVWRARSMRKSATTSRSRRGSRTTTSQKARRSLKACASSTGASEARRRRGRRHCNEAY